MKWNISKTVALMVLFCLPFLTGQALAEPVAVIVNVANPVESLDVSTVKKYYDNDLLKWPDGSRVVLYDLPGDEETRKLFSEKVLGKTPDEVERQWSNRKITNTAKNPPLILILDMLVQKRVGMARGAIGYIPRSKVTSDKVKVVAVLE